MVHANHAASDGGAAQVVHSQIGAALVLVFQPPETLGLARLVVAGELDKDRLAELGEYGDDIALGELVGESAKVDECRVAVVDVPGGFWRSVQRRLASCDLRPERNGWQMNVHSILDFLLVERLNGAYLVHGERSVGL
jgi:hypothetical protein